MTISPEAVDAMIVAGCLAVLCIMGLIVDALANRRAMKRAERILATQEALLRGVTDLGRKANDRTEARAANYRETNHGRD